MRILLDECIPRRFKRALAKDSCLTVAEAGFAGKKNGVLLGLAESAGFNLFLTIDKGIEYQQNLSGRTIAIVVVRAKSTRLKDLMLLHERCLSIVELILPGEVKRVGD